MSPTRWTRSLLATAGLAAAALPLAAQDSPCGDHPHCTQVTSFTATVTDFRESERGGYQYLSTTVRFRNLTGRTLILGYVSGSGMGTDDQGNRYNADPNSIRGIGVVSGNSVDAKFALQPGEESDARMEFSWYKSPNVIQGTRYVIELAIREVETLPGNQLRLGREHALQFRGFGAPQVTAAAPAPSAPAPAAAPGPAPDPCLGKSRCYSAGAFATQVTRFDESRQSGYHVLTFTLRFQNLTAQPLVLAYTAGTAVALDDRGNRYTPTRTPVRGMGVSQRGSADPSFSLQPGQTRDASFSVQFYASARTVLGTSYTFDLAVEELEILPRNQLRTAREFAVGFRDLSLKGPNPAQTLLDMVRGRP